MSHGGNLTTVRKTRTHIHTNRGNTHRLLKRGGLSGAPLEHFGFADGSRVHRAHWIEVIAAAATETQQALVIQTNVARKFGQI